jgi:ABC-type Fe3+/spermidine/putrescine transport system ATPase subunit
MADTQPTTNDRGSPAHEPETDMLEVRNLTKIYGDGTLAVDDISFSVPEGNFAVLIGPSGCGKSTTLHALVGKIEATEGTIFLDGEDVTNTPAYKRNIGLVFQDFQLFPHLTVKENVRYGLERVGYDEDEIERRCTQAWEQAPVRSVATPPSSPATAVPASGVGTAANQSRTHTTHP